MRSAGSLVGAFSLAAIAGCGGTVDGGPTAVTGVGGAVVGTGGYTSALPDGGGASGGRADAPDGGGESAPFHDPGCPPVTRIQGVHECDVGASLASCGSGERCVPYVTYGERCRTEEIGTQCTIAGVLVQGDDCANDPCADGYVCVSAGSGFECAQLCTVQGGKSDCPPGLLCSPLDVDGYSVCG